MTAESMLLLALDLAGFALAWRRHRVAASAPVAGLAYGFTLFLLLDFVCAAFVGSVSDGFQLFMDMGQNGSSVVIRLAALAVLAQMEYEDRRGAI